MQTLSLDPAHGAAGAAQTRSLDAGWLEWLAENRLRGCSTESMLQAMEAAGLARDAASAAIKSITLRPAYRLAERLDKRLAELESVLGNLQSVWQLAPDYGRIARRCAITDQQFLHDHVIGQRPVVLTELAPFDHGSRGRLFARYGPAQRGSSGGLVFSAARPWSVRG